jgi:hypothetical protein
MLMIWSGSPKCCSGESSASSSSALNELPLFLFLRGWPLASLHDT